MPHTGVLLALPVPPERYVSAPADDRAGDGRTSPQSRRSSWRVRTSATALARGEAAVSGRFLRLAPPRLEAKRVGTVHMLGWGQTRRWLLSSEVDPAVANP